MDLIYSKAFLGHDTGMHPENRKRLEAFGQLPESEIESGEQYLGLYHTKEYIEKVRVGCREGCALDQDTVCSKGSFQAAVMAVGATIKASETGGFALARPPGHHAHPERSSGFCLFNNVAIAAQRLANQGKKVLIFDFDGHLGDGTLKFFYGSDRVMYWSLHQFPAFPFAGSENDIGEGPGKGFSINVPLPPESGDDLYIRGIRQFLPVARQFNPDVVAISAGFDAHQHDLLLDLRVSVNAFHETGKILRENFKNLFATLEGGYNVETLPRCVYNFLDGINGASPRYSEEPTDSRIQVIDEFDARVTQLERNLREVWKI